MISENASSSPSSKPLSKPLLRALRGEAVWPPPVWLMRQAGRYLPEFRAMRDKADFLTRCMTPDMATELTIQPIRRYGMDGAILFSDILILPWAMGQSLDFIDGRGPVLGAIRSEADLARLDPKRVQDAVAPVRETLSRLAKELPDVTTLLGFAGSPFTVACYMVEGGGSRDFAETRRMMQTNPSLFDRLIDALTSSTAEMLCGQIEAGAEAVMLFDSWAGILPPFAFRRYVIEPTRQIVAYIRARHPNTPLIGFPRLGGIMVREYAQKTGINTLALDTVADPAQISELLSEAVPGLTLQGNMDPMILFSGGETMIREAQAIRDAMRGKPHVFNLGHGVMQHTPPENVAALVEAGTVCMTTALDPAGQLKLVIFDCDGVLVDSEGPSCRATAEFARSKGMSISDEEAHERFAGMALPQIVTELEHEIGHPLPPETAVTLRENLVQMMQKIAEPVGGAPEMLAGVRSLGLPVRVGSNSSVREMEIKFEKTGMSQYFPENRVHSANDMGCPKPAPDVYLYAAKAEGVLPESCVVIEDSDTGAEAAWKAGMACVLLRPEDMPAPPFWPVEGSVRITHLDELVPLLRRTLESQKTA